MKKIVLFMAVFSAAVSAQSQYLADFESPIQASESAWYGQDQVTDGDTIYTQNLLDFELNYNAGWSSFSGWAVSNFTDVITPGYTNQFSAIPGIGDSSSNQYGVCYVTEWNNNRIFLDNGYRTIFKSVAITNTTYAYLSMLNGDAVGKPFGEDTSATGVNDGTNGEDWFLLTIYELGFDSLRNGDSINFYLADYRFASSADDYIIDSWQTIDLGPLQATVGLDFVLTSSDTSGGFGMNTPAYFAMDNLFIDFLGGTNELEIGQVSAYPNPTQNSLRIETMAGDQLQLFDLNGRLVKSELANASLVDWNIADLSEGVYTLIVSNGTTVNQARIIKQ